jgi:hypothetical protein
MGIDFQNMGVHFQNIGIDFQSIGIIWKRRKSFWQRRGSSDKEGNQFDKEGWLILDRDQFDKDRMILTMKGAIKRPFFSERLGFIVSRLSREGLEPAPKRRGWLCSGANFQ